MFKQLSKQLFIGTHRELEKISGVSEYTESFFADLTNLAITPEEKLLNQCVVISFFDDAGYLPEIKPPLQFNIADDDLRPICSPKSAEMLTSALSVKYSSITIEWIMVISQIGKRPPFHNLPALLTMGEKNKIYRPIIAKIVGERGHWLAEKNPKWLWFLEQDKIKLQDIAMWEEGNPKERCRFIQEMHSSNPEQAHQLLKTGMVGEKASNRAKLIGMLKNNLSIFDENYLETQLNDKSIEVRQMVASLLSLIPSTAFSKRMALRMEACVSYQKGFLKHALNISPPESVDSTMKRDGITEKVTSGLGLKATILQKITAQTPLSWWETNIPNHSPADIFALIKKSEWEHALLLGLANAAISQQNTIWLIALYRHKLPEKLYLDYDKLLKAIPHNELEKWAPTLFANNSLNAVLFFCKNPANGEYPYWSEKISKALLVAVQKLILTHKLIRELPDILHTLAFYVHPNLLNITEANWPKTHPKWDSYNLYLNEYSEIIKFRKNLYKELSV